MRMISYLCGAELLLQVPASDPIPEGIFHLMRGADDCGWYMTGETITTICLAADDQPYMNWEIRIYCDRITAPEEQQC